MNDTNKYLTINQLAQACSISRASLLRMEKDGVLAPAYINPESGYRYYDTSSVLRVARNISMQELGITHKELQKYYSTSDNYQELIDLLQRKMAMMEYHIESLKVQLKITEHLSLSHFGFPELYCYTKRITELTNISELHPHIWTAFQEAIEKGYSVDRRMHPFLCADIEKVRENNYRNLGDDYTICIPVMEKKDSDELVKFEAVDTLSVILYGGSVDVRKAFEEIEEEKKRSNYACDNIIRLIAQVTSFPGEDIPIDYWAFRVSLPIR